MSRILTASASLSLLLLAGCQALSYQPPTGDDTASITFTSDNIAVQPVICVPGSGFRSTSMALAHKPFQSEFFDELNAGLRKAESVTTDVSTISGSALVGFILQERPREGMAKRCKTAARFPVQAGASYQAHFLYEGGHCGIQIKDASGAPLADAVATPWQCN